jgi:RluA family pseudouridine synthase
VAIEILHETAGVLAVNKPPGVAVIPARGEPEADSLWRRLEAERGERLWVVHRIDRDTSGIVLFARDAATHRALSMAFEARRVKKTYLALAAGDLPEKGRIDAALHPARKGKTRPALPGEADARPAVTDIEVTRRWSRAGATVVLASCRPLTGRHHQIRVHLRSREAPILGDPLYGKRTLGGLLGDAPCPRLMLHAAALDLPGPGAGGVAELEGQALRAPMPADMARLVRWLDGAFAAGSS